MVRIGIYILTFLVSFNSLCLDQLLKLPVLCQHYNEHKETNKNLDVLDFLAMHYLGDDLNDNDHDKDMQLPFKGMDNHTLNLIMTPFTEAADIIFFSLQNDRQKVNTKKHLHSISLYTTLLRPPSM